MGSIRGVGVGGALVAFTNSILGKGSTLSQSKDGITTKRQKNLSMILDERRCCVAMYL
jgi:hypothetical protein